MDNRRTPTVLCLLVIMFVWFHNKFMALLVGGGGGGGELHFTCTHPPLVVSFETDLELCVQKVWESNL